MSSLTTTLAMLASASRAQHLWRGDDRLEQTSDEYAHTESGQPVLLGADDRTDDLKERGNTDDCGRAAELAGRTAHCDVVRLRHAR